MRTFWVFLYDEEGELPVRRDVAVGGGRKEIHAPCRRQPVFKAVKPVDGVRAVCTIVINLAVVDGYSATNDAPVQKR